MRNAAIALLLALSMTLAGLPLVPAIVAGEQHAFFSMDICHPAQAVSAASIQCSLPLRPIQELEHAAIPVARWQEVIIPLISIDPARPIPPPPESSLIYTYSLIFADSKLRA